VPERLFWRGENNILQKVEATRTRKRDLVPEEGMKYENWPAKHLMKKGRRTTGEYEGEERGTLKPGAATGVKSTLWSGGGGNQQSRSVATDP